MAAVRPIVLVYQDFATVSVPVALPDLNVAVVGPAYAIRDYATNKSEIGLGVVGSLITPPSGVASSGASLSATDVPGLPTGALIDKTGIPPVLFVDGYVELAASNDGIIAESQNTFVSATNFNTAGVAPGDRLVVTDLDTDSGVVTVARTIQSISADGLTLYTTQNFGKAVGVDVSGVALNITTLKLNTLKFRVERPVTGALVDQTVTVAGTATVPTVAATGLTTKIATVSKPVTYGNVYVQYRALRQDLDKITSIEQEADIVGQLGPIDERNPLAVGAFMALVNSNKVVQAVGVLSDDILGHTGARDTLNASRTVYAIVPLTQDVATIAMWKTSVRTLAAPEISKLRVVIGNTSLPTTKVVYPDSGTASGTAESDTASTFKLLDNTATFLTSGVAVGDLVTISAVKYAVAQVLSDNRLVLVGTLSPGSVSYAITRTFTKAQQVDELIAVAERLKDARCTMVWPDSCKLSGVKNNYTGVTNTQPGYYLAAAVGGMVAGLPPHQGFTFIGIAGVSEIFHSNSYFYDSQIDALSSAGWYVIAQDAVGSTPYCVHELTTDTTTLETGELMVVKNFDYVSLTIRNALLGFLGVYNVTKSTMDFLRSAVDGAGEQLRLRTYPKIGSPLISMEIKSVEVLSGAKDQIEIFAVVQIPRPLNRIGLHLTA